MTPDQARQLDALQTFIATYPRDGRTRREFWNEFTARASGIPEIVFGDAPDIELADRYLDILAAANGFCPCPPGSEDEPMD